jgi:hypothetical protein
MDSGKEVSTTTSAPWGPQIPYLTQGMQFAGGLLPKSTSVSPNSYLTGGRNAIYNMGINAATNPLLVGAGNAAQNIAARGIDFGGANNYYNKVLAGNFLGPNPYADAVYDQMAGRMRGQVDANASAAGRYGSGIHQDVLQQGLSEMANNMYYQNYAQERANQQAAAQGLSGNLGASTQARLSAAGMLPNIYGNQMQGLAAAQGVGQDIQRDLMAQKLEPWQRGQNFMGLIGGQYGGTQQTPYYTPSPFSQLLGAGATAASFMVPGMGPAAGALGGGLPF